jgi:DMSO/TMAO reductase YedYZ molybdopterin-dependent catalytic subunit
MNQAERSTRRGVLRTAAALGTLWLTGCDRLSDNPRVQRLLGQAEGWSRRMARIVGGSAPLAREYTRADLSPSFRANGSTDPDSDEYRDHVSNGFRDWRLTVDGLVEQARGFSLDELRALPARSQITRHDCVEGWSCIGQWQGARLSALLAAVRLKPQARYLVLHCADALEGPDLYYESIDIDEAMHEQSILAYEMNGAPLPVAHGAPLRLRVERQLGYKQAKYVMRIEAVESYAAIGGGRGGFWEDRGYAWYAGI